MKPCAGQSFFLPRIPMSAEAGALPFPLRRKQYPVKFAWAMSINKAQGQSLQKVGLLLQESVFAHGQLYVALSRASGFQNVRVRVETTTSQGLRENSVGVSQGTYADNIVSKDILLDGASISHPGESFSAQDCDDPKPTTICLKLLP